MSTGYWRFFPAFFGRFQRAAKDRAEALGIFRWMGDAEGQSLVCSNLSREYGVLGQEEAAFAQAETALELARSRQLPRAEMYALVSRAWLQLYLDQVTTAPADLEGAWGLCQRSVLKECEAEILRLQAELALNGGRHRQA